jgi:UDP-GlcNAc:undecaprenyl-phosphate GlcNAc-1-phosphate transferase
MGRIALSRGIVDRPRGRHIHAEPIPFLGGVAMYVAFFLATVVFGRPDRNTIGLLAGGAFAVALGVADDKWELRPRKKLMGQIVAAVIVMLFGVKIEFVTNPLGGMIYLGALSIPITLVWVVAFMNVVNFIDGLDGLAAGVSAIGSIAMALAALEGGQSRLVVLSMALAGSALGFLRHNFHPARIFMGDAGAMFLGFTIAGISAIGALKTPATLVLAVPVIVMGVPVLDTAFAIFRRVRRGVPVSSSDRDHVHHRLLAMGMTQRQAVLTLYTVSALLAATACGVAAVNPLLGIGGTVTAFCALIIVGGKSGILKSDIRRRDRD